MGAINDFRINHRGFLPSSQKRFILTENDTGSRVFSVYLTDNVREIKVYEGEMAVYTEDGKDLFVGDFSSITKEGDYFIEVDKKRSRQFIIYEKAYDICQRIMLEYFKYQRCGHPLGWNGKCHTDDGYIKETGEHVDLSGGYHQSCDLRKSPGGISIGVLSMLRFAVKDKSEWGEILLADEARWALEYYIKVIGENGAMYNTLNDPLGWEGRIFYKSPAPSSAQWNVTSSLALGYVYFKEKDTDFAKKCLEKAILSYDFLMGDKRPTEVYKHPDKFGLGMDPDFFYEQCKKGTTADLAYQITASADLYRITGKEEYLEVVRACVPLVADCLKDGYVLMQNERPERTVTSSCSYSWLMSGLLSLLDGYELLNSPELKEKILKALDGVCEFCAKSPWQSIERVYSEGDLDAPCGHENKTLRQSLSDLVRFGNYHYTKRDFFEPSYACYMGIFLARGAKLTGDKKYMGYAQSIADSLLGANVLDSSHIRAVGYNNPQHYSYGQFFPSTPFIPGAVGVGYTSLDSTSEYDMPCVGLSMYLLSEIE